MRQTMETFVPLTFHRRGAQRVAVDDRSVHDITLIEGMARAFYWQRLLDEGRFHSITEIAEAEGIDLGQASKISRLAHLAPDLTEAIALGRLEVGVSPLRGRLPVSWQAQRHMLEVDLSQQV